MSQIPTREASAAPHDTADAPLHDTRAIVFAVKEAESMRSAEVRHDRGEYGSSALDAVWRYVDEHGGRADLLTVGEPRTPDLGNYRDSGTPRGGQLSSLGLTRYLKLASPADGAGLLDALRRGGEIEYADFPAIHRVMDPRRDWSPPAGGFDAIRSAYPDGTRSADPRFDAPPRPWWLEMCGFPEVRAARAESTPPRPIGVIDEGPDYGHPELRGRIREVHVLPPGASPSQSVHASAVAGVIAAQRDERRADGAAGCCGAEIELYNVATVSGFEPLAYYDALAEAARRRLPVVNLSLGTPVYERHVEKLIQDLLAADVVVVAAVGDLAERGSPPRYPAAYEGVVSVGALGQAGVPSEHTSRGERIWISAPGESIRTVYGPREYRLETGTSFAAAMVSAAAWMARGIRSTLAPATVRRLLADTAAPIGGGRYPDAGGHGRLDVARLLEEVARLPDGTRRWYPTSRGEEYGNPRGAWPGTPRG